ncbi:hypothetical protein MIR68_003181 [Amoeboaphelidium protococcarum]|nr:hypothetical protein MIR68_003181 [Amoeboaphelidium protococcarum]
MVAPEQPPSFESVQRKQPTVAVLQEIVNGRNSPLIVGEMVYIVSAAWFNQLSSQLSQSGKLGGDIGSSIGPVDNSSLLDVDGQLKKGMIDSVDYEIVPKVAHDLILEYFGYQAQAPNFIERYVIRDSKGNVSVEVYHCEYEVQRYSSSSGISPLGSGLTDGQSICYISVSKMITLAQLKELCCRELCIVDSLADVRLWSAFSDDDKQFNLCNGDDDTVLDDLQLKDDSLIMVEVNDDGWPTDLDPEFGKRKKAHLVNGGNGFSSASGIQWNQARSSQSQLVQIPSSFNAPVNNGGIGSNHQSEYSLVPGSWSMERQRFSPDRAKVVPGLCGLGNLGNTCFMNSALQCLSNTVPLTQYFTTGKYKTEINLDNPLGMHGEIAEAYGSLVNSMWNGSGEDYVSPRDFKFTIGRFAPQFVGYQQHDSQELTAFLLDGLHEDLNRIKKKPFIEMPDYDPDKHTESEYADHLWDMHKQRNDSVIVDLFQGQYKSKLVCPECSKVSVTFDPFMYLSLPLPIKKMVTFKFTFVPNLSTFMTEIDGESESALTRIKSFTLHLDNSTSFGQLRKIICDKLNLQSAGRLKFGEVWSHKMYQVFTDDNTVKDVEPHDVIFLYELADELYSNSGHGSTVAIPCNLYCDNQSFGFPFYISIRKSEMNYQSVYDKICRVVSSYTGVDMSDSPPLSDDHSNSSSSEWFDLLLQRDSSAGYGSSLYGAKKLNSLDSEISFDNRSQLIMDFSAENKERLFGQISDGAIDGQSNSNGHATSLDSQNGTTSSSSGEVSLYDCFKYFSTPEILGENDAWYCPRCKKHQQASKKMDLYKLPDVLVVHLKRFSHTRNRRDKIENFIDFPVYGLDLSEYTLQRQQISSGSVVGNTSSEFQESISNTMDVDGDQYDLYAISNHMGGLGGGHYTAYAKNKLDGNWYHFDDSRVSAVQESEIKTRYAYMLFYQKRSVTSSQQQSSTEQ